MLRYVATLITGSILLLSACSPTPAAVNNSGHEPYIQGDYTAALDVYRRAQERAPHLGEPHYNAGNTVYKQEEYQIAVGDYDRAISHMEGANRLNGLFNRGNAAFQLGMYQAAAEAYIEVLRIDPDDLDAKHNLELALKRLPPQGQDAAEQEQEQSDDSQAEEQEEEEQQDEEQSEQSEDDNQEQEQEQEQQPPTQPESMTEQQARQILESVGEQAGTLQEKRQQVLVSEDEPSEFDW